MKKFKFVVLVAAVMIITLLSVTGVWAGSLQQDSETSGTASGAGQRVLDPATLPAAPTGLTTYAAVYQASPGLVCFTVPWGQNVQNPTIRVLDSGSWTSSGITTTLSGIAPDGSGLQYCASVGAGTFALQGY
ncbi:MAG: hypothetical protein HN413_01435 [Chloroflexi bacterium]|jgi:hypothetical protein|nr:hypothetical protein [Chloroflexota bacterium]